jgi:hypothetical protein
MIWRGLGGGTAGRPSGQGRHDARHLFDEMLEQIMFPDIASFNKVLQVIARLS